MFTANQQRVSDIDGGMPSGAMEPLSILAVGDSIPAFELLSSEWLNPADASSMQPSKGGLVT